VISEIPHKKQRYETVGDWIPGKTTHIKVSKMKDERYTFLVALHEMIEYELCRMNGVSDEKVVAFDKAFESERALGFHAWEDEPGDDTRSPYKKEHQFATTVERMVAQRMGVRWGHYERTVMALDKRPRRMTLRPLPARRAGARLFARSPNARLQLR
jgi:hypothetical protein